MCSDCSVTPRPLLWLPCVAAGSERCSPRPLLPRAPPCPPVPSVRPERPPGSGSQLQASAGLSSFPAAFSEFGPPCWVASGPSLGGFSTHLRSHSFCGSGAVGTAERLLCSGSHQAAIPSVGWAGEGSPSSPSCWQSPFFVVLGLRSLLSCWPSTRGHPALLEATHSPVRSPNLHGGSRSVTTLGLPGRSGAAAAPGFGSGGAHLACRLGRRADAPCASFVSGVESSPHGPRWLHNEPA